MEGIDIIGVKFMEQLQGNSESSALEEIGWQYDLLAHQAIKGLERNNIPAQFVPNRETALMQITKNITEGITVGIGDSMTLQQIGLFSWLEQQNIQVFNPFLRYSDGRLKITGSERFEVMRKAMIADIFITGTNAITLDGKLINIDGHGNRVAPMIFGPRQALIIVGANKIVKDEAAAFQRIYCSAAPLNAWRHAQRPNAEYFNELPCVITGQCANCHHADKLCRKIVIIDGQSPRYLLPGEQGLKVIIVGESIGL